MDIVDLRVRKWGQKREVRVVSLICSIGIGSQGRNCSPMEVLHLVSLLSLVQKDIEKVHFFSNRKITSYTVLSFSPKKG